MKIYENEYIKFINGDCQEIIKTIPSESLNVILTDPPYLYLKNQVLEREFEEEFMFSQFMRILKPGGFVVMFGRGTSFYRWNTILANLGFEFKEEIIWDKSMGSSPLSKLCRIHETVSIHVTGKATINKVKIPYLKAKDFDVNKIAIDVNRIASTLDNPQSLKFLKDFIDGKRSDMELNTRFTKHKVTSDIRKSGAREVNTLASICNGITEKSIIGDHIEGYNDTIIKVLRDHYNTIHPTQKPVEILKRLLALVVKSENDVVADFFAGSASLGEACMDMKLKCILTEIHEPYYNLGVERLDTVYRNRDTQTKLF